jgi:hypothetical protein
MLSRLATEWLRWLRRCAVPDSHTALLLELTDDEIASYAPRRWTVQPDGPPRRGGKPHSLHGPSGTKARKLTELGYPSERIAKILAVPIAAVRSFLTRTTPVRGAGMVKPRTQREQRALNRRRHRRRPPPPPPSTWGWAGAHLDSDAWTPPPAAVPAQICTAELVEVLDLVNVAVAAPLAAELEKPATVDRPVWSDPRAMYGSASGQSKLTPADVLRIRELHAAGRSIYSLAPEFGVSKSAIRQAVRGVTWGPLLCPEPPAENPG